MANFKNSIFTLFYKCMQFYYLPFVLFTRSNTIFYMLGNMLYFVFVRKKYFNCLFFVEKNMFNQQLCMHVCVCRGCGCVYVGAANMCVCRSCRCVCIWGLRRCVYVGAAGVCVCVYMQGLPTCVCM